MGVAAMQWTVHPGQGRVANFGTVAAVVSHPAPEQESAAAELLALIRVATAAHAGRATDLFGVVSDLVLRTGPALLPPFGIVADDGTRLAAMLYGDIELATTHADGTRQVMSGAVAGASIDLTIADGATMIVLLPAGELTGADTDTDLEAGVVSGTGLSAGVRIGLQSQLTDRFFATGPVTATGDFLSIDLVGTAPAGAPDALPRTGQEVSALVRAVAAAHAVLTADDGSSYPLTHDYLVGREPGRSPDLASGVVGALTLADPSVSRIHARVSIDADGVWVEDLGSANGTRVIGPGAQKWAILVPRTRTPIAPGTRIGLGRRGLVCNYQPPVAPMEVPAPPVIVARPAATTSGSLGGVADYVFTRRLGRGYQGELFLAAPPERLGIDDESVVVKVVSGETSDDAFRRAVRELRAYAGVQSQFLLTVYDAGNDAGQFFYSTQYVTGGSLARAVGRLSRPEMMGAVAQAARATHALHEAGLLHQRITPGAILLGADHAYLSDVGASQSLVRDQTLTGLGPVGDVEFLDPQILSGDRGSRATDIWALAATLYRVLTGVSIYGDFPHEPLLAIRRALTSRPTLPVELDAALMDLIKGGLHFPGHDTVSAAEFAERIESLLH